MVMLRLLCDLHAPTEYQEPNFDNKTINLLQFLDLRPSKDLNLQEKFDLQEKPKSLPEY
jgi:hypothetical protein